MVIYHGDNHNTTSLDPALMNNGNNEIGIGISFGSYEVAETYGKNIVEALINPERFVDARGDLGEEIDSECITKLLLELHPINKDFLYYELTDWGYEIMDRNSIEEDEAFLLVRCYQDEEVRNFQTSMAKAYGVEKFVEAWNKHVKIDGTFLKRTEDETWYAIINTDISVEKIEGN